MPFVALTPLGRESRAEIDLWVRPALNLFGEMGRGSWSLCIPSQEYKELTQKAFFLVTRL